MLPCLYTAVCSCLVFLSRILVARAFYYNFIVVYGICPVYRSTVVYIAVYF